MSIVVRDSTPEDVSSVQAIYGHHVLHGLASFEEVPPSMEEMRRRRDEVLERGFPYLVAEIAGTVLGYAYVSPYRARSAYRYAVENSVYVRHDAVARGIGPLPARRAHRPLRAAGTSGGDRGYRR